MTSCSRLDKNMRFGLTMPLNVADVAARDGGETGTAADVPTEAMVKALILGPGC